MRQNVLRRRGVTSICWTASLILFVIGGCKSREQTAAEATTEQINQFAGAVSNVKDIDRNMLKKYEAQYAAFKDSLDSYKDLDAVDEQSKSSMNSQLTSIRQKLDSMTYLIVLNRMIGLYKGHGQTATKVPDWGIVPSGVIMTEILIKRDQQTFASSSSPDFRTYQSSFKIVDIEEKGDTAIVGYFQNTATGVHFCSFEWSPSKLSLEGNLWKSDNTRQ